VCTRNLPNRPLILIDGPKSAHYAYDTFAQANKRKEAKKNIELPIKKVASRFKLAITT